MKIGTIINVNNNIPLEDNGMVKCDGRTLLIEDYPELFAVIGTQYGEDGDTGFKVPSMEDGGEIFQFAIVAKDLPIPADESIEIEPEVDPTLAVSGSIQSAKEFGQFLINKFALENVLGEITQANKTYAVSIYCQKMQLFLQTGSLYAALEELDLMIADTGDVKTSLSPFVTDSLLNGYKSLILGYLGR